jgi:hypothetical protein
LNTTGPNGHRRESVLNGQTVQIVLNAPTSQIGRNVRSALNGLIIPAAVADHLKNRIGRP